ncbi:MAG TPA: hypothetical protein VGM76_17950 [Lacipirellulaceae bacterium]|jgi:hypothetical protein
MPAEDDDDVYNDEYDFVDDESDDETDDDVDDEEDIAEDEPAEEDAPVRGAADPDGELVEGDADEYSRPAPLANYVVHVYEHQKFKRTIDRPFTAEDAEAFSSEYNRTAKPYGRFAVAGKDDAKPRKSLD